MSLLGSISHGFEAMAESITGSIEARPEVVQSRLMVIKDAIDDASHIYTVEVPSPVETQHTEQAPTVDFIPTPPQAETVAPVTFTDETFSTAVPVNPQPTSDLDADQIRAKLDTIRFAQMDTQALAEMANRSQN